ncbi:hypothetical protein [Neisseria sp. Ec49-e6-T10]|uniref:hypothetical protein n=1 Tax=Neisseria sp. Ec49-e6-T10 TaxID=3140744 RepID=UPI003EBD0BDA
MNPLILEASTDIAEVVLFSFDGLPETYTSNIKALEEDKKLLRIHTEADGAFIIHLYIDTDIPEDLLYNVETEIENQELRLYDGQFAFGGAEEICDSFYGDRIDIQPGVYKVSIFSVDYSEFENDDRIQKCNDTIREKTIAKIGESAYIEVSNKIYKQQNGCLFTLILCIIASIILLFSSLSYKILWIIGIFILFFNINNIFFKQKPTKNEKIFFQIKDETEKLYFYHYIGMMKKID